MNSRKTRLLYVPAAAALLAVLAFVAPQPSTGQVAPAATDLDELSQALVVQTALLVNQQATMDAKIATIEESVRQARIFAARSGGVKK